MRAVKLAVAIVVASLALPLSPVPADAQQERRALKHKTKKHKTKKQAKRPAQKPASAWSGDGIPSCSGILWVDSQCRRADGKICMVGDEDLHNCI